MDSIIKDEVFHILRLAGNTSVTEDIVNAALADNVEDKDVDFDIMYTAEALQSYKTVPLDKVDFVLLTTVNNILTNRMIICKDAIRSSTINLSGMDILPVTMEQLEHDLETLNNGILNKAERIFAGFSYIAQYVPFARVSMETVLTYLALALRYELGGTIETLGSNYTEFYDVLDKCHNKGTSVPMYNFLRRTYGHLSVK